MLIRYILVIISSSHFISCVTPSKWEPESHQEVMLMCKAMCGKDRVKSYEPFTGTCECINGSASRVNESHPFIKDML